MSVFSFIKNKKTVQKPFTTAILLAAGQGTRMRGVCDNKINLSLNGMPVLAHTLIAFESAQTIDKIVVVTSEENLLFASDLANHFLIKKVDIIIKGGDTRQQSAAIGVNSCPYSDFICIHDAARPFITAQLIDSVNLMAFEHGAATAGVPVKDTIKRVDQNGFILKTLPRSTLWVTQTPQSFNRAVYLTMLNNALLNKKVYSDDCQLFEACNQPVVMVEGDYNNIKITTPEDINLAEAILNFDLDV